MAYLDQHFADRGGLKPFLKEWYLSSPRGAFSTELFRDQMGEFFGESLNEFFDKYIFGKNQTVDPKFDLDNDDVDYGEELQIISPVDRIFDYHPVYSEQDLRKLL